MVEAGLRFPSVLLSGAGGFYTSALCGRDDEQIDRCETVRVVGEKGPPSLRPWPTRAGYLIGHLTLATGALTTVGQNMCAGLLSSTSRLAGLTSFDAETAVAKIRKAESALSSWALL